MTVAIKPKFRPDITVTRPIGSSDIVLKDPVSEKFYRLTSYEFRLLKALDGRRTLEETVDHLRESGAYYTKEAAENITSKAARFGLILGAGQSARQMRKAIKEQAEKAKKVRIFSSLYFLFIPVLNPDRFLERTLWVYRLFVNRITFAIITALAPIAIWLVISGADRLTSEYLYFFNWRNLFLLWVVIFLTKLVHEFSHAYTAKSFGLHVPDMGIAFLIFFPCLYCNTTDAWGLAKRRQRIAISAAGIASEASLAILSTFVWYFSRPGIINSLAFYLMAISFFSTVLFNGNPLMKFDGYFILIDWLRIPNLASKSMGHMKHLFLNRVLGVGSVESPAARPEERFIYSVYGVSSFIYRLFLYMSIVLGVYFKFDKTLGIVLAGLAMILFVFRPLFMGVKRLHSLRGQIKPRFMGTLFLFLIIGLILAALFTPWSGGSVFLCYLDSGRKQALTVPMKTQVDEVFVEKGASVEKGQILFTLDTEALRHSLELTIGKKRIKSKDLKFMLVDEEKFADAGKKAVELLYVEDEIEKIRKELHLARLEIVADFSGKITSLDYRMSKGFQPGAGVIVGELESDRRLVVHGLIPAQDLHKVNEGLKATVWFPLRTGKTYEVTISSLKPYSEKDLRDSPFSSKFGGELATERAGSDGPETPLEAYYQCSAPINMLPEEARLGITGRLKIAEPPRSLASILFRKAAAVFNRETLF